MSHLGVGSFKKRTREWYGKIGGRPSPIVHRLYLITYDVQKKNIMNILLLIGFKKLIIFYALKKHWRHQMYI